MDKPQIIVHIQKNLNYTIYDTKWIPCSAKFISLGSYARATGALQVYEINKGQLELVCEAEKKHSFRCGTFGATSTHKRHVATGDFDGRLSTWDLSSLDLPVFTVKAHSQIINAIDGCGGVGIGEGAPEIVTGSRDGSVKVWDVRQRDVPVAKMEPNEGEKTRDCWTVAFGNSYSDTERMVCAGYDNGDVKMFDLRNMSVHWETNVKNGVCGIEFDRKNINMNKLVVTSLESKLHLFDLRTLNKESGYASLVMKAHKSTVWSCSHLPQNRDIFMTTGGDGSLYLWKYRYPAKRFKESEKGSNEGVIGNLDLIQNAVLSDQPVSTMDWNRDKEGLLVCPSFDQSVRVCIVTKLNLA